MSIEVTIRNKEIPASLSDYATEKGKAFEADFPKTTQFHVILDTEPHLFKAHFSATVCGTQFDSTGEDADNFIKAIDDAADKLYRQARKHQDKIGDNHKA